MAIDSPLTFERSPGKAPGTAIYHLNGSLTLHTLPLLHAEWASEEPAPRTIVDLTLVPYMDSAGMSEIINYQVLCQRKNARLFIVGSSARLLRMFHVTKVDGLMTLVDTVEEAEAAC